MAATDTKFRQKNAWKLPGNGDGCEYDDDGDDGNYDDG